MARVSMRFSVALDVLVSNGCMLLMSSRSTGARHTEKHKSEARRHAVGGDVEVLQKIKIIWSPYRHMHVHMLGGCMNDCTTEEICM